ncbi:hypothetical protein BLNAU_2111 [Blattamonas nauphoetae]|uniref:Uncharacterized protein n=1 Tax=Blattamonas nauphoetae TaxID=2049346 RepID=A0ABQ9YH47_9EUKA|nr:hypothetical protein BLNAU_2111 [Blattamonas nauphoetae]
MMMTSGAFGMGPVYLAKSIVSGGDFLRNLPPDTLNPLSQTLFKTTRHNGPMPSILIKITLSLKEWRKQGQEVVQSGKQILQALFLEGFEVTLEQKLLNDTDEYDGLRVVDDCLNISKLLELNVKKLR